MTVVLVFLWRFHARGRVEVVDSPWETINVEDSAREQLPGCQECASVSLCTVESDPCLLAWPWEKRENLGKTKLVGLRYCSTSYQLQKPAAIVNHKGGG